MCKVSIYGGVLSRFVKFSKKKSKKIKFVKFHTFIWKKNQENWKNEKLREQNIENLGGKALRQEWPGGSSASLSVYIINKKYVMEFVESRRLVVLNNQQEEDVI